MAESGPSDEQEAALQAAADRIDDRDTAGAEAALERLAEYPAGRQQGTKLIAEAIFAARDDDEKRAIFDFLSPAVIASLHFVSGTNGRFARAMMMTSWHDETAALLRAACDLVPDDAGLAYQYVRFLTRIDRPDELKRFIDERDEMFGDPANLMALLPGTGLTAEQRDAVRTLVEEMGPDTPKATRLLAVRWLANHGMWEAAAGAAHRLGVKGSAFRATGMLLDLIDEAPDTGSRPEPFEGADDVYLRRAPESGGLVLLFGAVGDANLLTLWLIDRYLAALGLSSLIMRDNHRMVFMQGVRSLAPDRDGTIDRLRAIIDDLGVERLYTLSSSGGGFGAMAYGLMLTAERCLCFSPVSRIGGVAEHDPRTPVIRERLERQCPPAEWDILDWIDRTEHRMPISLYYGRDKAVDRFHAEHLAGQPDVNLFPVESGGKGGSLLAVAAQRDLGEVIARAFDLESP
ncbi:hypothetical protein HFP57_13115 [Parasphingopyxis algicola]|uniref:hypothetical protein n=1 Tax=Parasphingopyxis algicola TaxID=2026624 RepID=UPI0015A38F44|nr:hypothetical protein [Parasphingopyxis algicola]QLC25870.1 hypothetical protein HFP57_13115 [Parasphingopyxis algicola]